jgi:uncharacterized protein (DUF2141 family)
MKISTIAASIAALAAPAAVHGSAADRARLVLTFETGAATGAVMVSLYDNEAAYAGGAPVRQARIDVAKGERTATFDALEAGDYAVKAFHDVNGDGRMNTNPFGLPTEPSAFSNNAHGSMGPARWNQARIKVQGAIVQTIELR